MLCDMYSVSEIIEKHVLDYDLPREIIDLLTSFYGLTETPFDGDTFNQVLRSFKEKCDYSRMNTNIACMYAALLSVMYENPKSKILRMLELVEVIRNTGFRSRVSNMMAVALLDDFGDIESRVVRTLKIYHEMHERHGFITGEDDYLATLYMADVEGTIEDLIQQIEANYHELSGLSFSKGNALQALSHHLILIEGQERLQLIQDAQQWHLTFKKHRIKTNSSQIIIFGFLTGLGVNREDYMLRLESATEELLARTGEKRMHSLNRTVLFLEVAKSMLKEDGFVITDERKKFVEASMLLLLTSYLFRERLI